MTAAIEITGARKVYVGGLGHSDRIGVDDVSLAVAQGSVHGLLGANGAGKTTTLKMLLGLVRPTAGYFRILGADSTRAPGRAEVGFLPEQPYFPAQLTAGQLMRFYGRMAGLFRTQDANRGRRLLAQVGLEDQEHVRLSKFSRGMLQRLGLAQALLGEPKVLILDEPASGLDPIGQADVRNLILDLARGGTTILLSSHQLSEVEAICDRVTIVNKGRVAAEGSINDLLNTAGRTSVRAEGIDALPEPVRGFVEDVAASGGMWLFSVADGRVRQVVDAIDDAGGRVLSIAPKHESLEEYFRGLLDQAAQALEASPASGPGSASDLSHKTPGSS